MCFKLHYDYLFHSKDQAIKHLTEEKQRWNELPFDQHSLAPSRLDTAALSDGGYSDGATEYEREEQPKKSSKKKGGGLIGVRYLSLQSTSCTNIIFIANSAH